MTRETLTEAEDFVASHLDEARAAGSESLSGDALLWLAPEGEFFLTSDYQNHARFASFIGIVDPLSGKLTATRF